MCDYEYSDIPEMCIWCDNYTDGRSFLCDDCQTVVKERKEAVRDLLMRKIGGNNISFSVDFPIEIIKTVIRRKDE